MSSTLLFWLAGFMAILVFANVYIRVRVWKYYNNLMRKKVEFPMNYILDKKKLEAEVIPRYPDSREDILSFSKGIQTSLRIVSILLFLITAVAVVLFFFTD